MRKLDPADDTVFLALKVPAAEMAWLNGLANRTGLNRSKILRLVIAFAREHEELVFGDLVCKEVLEEAS